MLQQFVFRLFRIPSLIILVYGFGSCDIKLADRIGTENSFSVFNIGIHVHGSMEYRHIPDHPQIILYKGRLHVLIKMLVSIDDIQINSKWEIIIIFRIRKVMRNFKAYLLTFKLCIW